MNRDIFKIAAFLILGLLATSCNSGKNEYPEEVKKNFIKSCSESSGGQEKTCECLLEKLQMTYTIEEFSILEVKISNGQTPDDFIEFLGKARIDCMHYK